MTSRTPRLIAAILLMASFGAGCSSGDDATGDRGDAGGSAELRIVDFAFEPATLKVDAGEMITVVNEDDAKHTVTSGSRDKIDGKFDVVVEAGATETLTIDDPGTYPFVCTIHPGMKGTIEVAS